MALASGTRLGPYEIVAPLGAGGMGEVYRAKDTRLDRTVAVKVLPSHVAATPEARQRFEREARAVSSLNHPHICVLHDIGQQDGIDFLVMEYLEGETLAARLTKGPLPMAQAVEYAIQIADALAQAHKQGVFHRDLKPGNIMLIKSGAKLLDFGLAKVALDFAGETAATRGLTQKGTILGTLQYMAPEQLEGKETDARGDIFAFGAVLYEMVTGRKAFEGKSHASLIAAILEHDPPPLSSVQPLTSRALERAVKRCLAKDPDDRWQTARDLKAELQWFTEVTAPAVAPPRGARRSLVPWLVAAVATLAALVLAIAPLAEKPKEPAVTRFSVSPPGKLSFRNGEVPVVSPDGRRVIYGGVTDGKSLLWVRPLDSLTAQSIPGTEGAINTFWSADSRSIAFYAGGKLKKVDLMGGPAQSLADAASGGGGGAWNRDGVIVFRRGLDEQLYRVAAAGGEATPVTTLDASRQEGGHHWPYFLPDGRHFLYLATSQQPEDSGIYVGSLDSTETKRLVSADLRAVYTAGRLSGPGYLIFGRGSTLMGQSFDARKMQLAGEPFPIVEQIDIRSGGVRGGGAFSVSDQGVLAYRTGSGARNAQLVWFDRAGKRLGTIGESAEYSHLSLSPDEKKLAVAIGDAGQQNRDIWVLDLARGVRSRFTFDAADDFNPLWSPDGSRIAFVSTRKGVRDLYVKRADGGGADEVMLASQESKQLQDWSRDGQSVVINMQARGVWVLHLDGNRTPVSILQGIVEPVDQAQDKLSPNNRWIAYSSNESGRPEVYVQSFPPSGGRWQISTGGGSEPRWRQDGKELFYMAPDSTLMAVDVKTDSDSFGTGTAKPLFGVSLPTFPNRNRYVVAANGQRFLVETVTDEAASAPFTVVLNWTAGLKR